MEENNNASKELNNANDKGFKGLMGLKPVVRAYVEQFVPKEKLDKLDLDTLELDNTTYITDELSEAFADSVWKCRFKKGIGQAKIAFLQEHKSYKPNYPHLQVLDYIRGAWRTQIAETKQPVLMIPIILYHGQEKWELESFESYFGDIDPEFLCYLPAFSIIFVNMQKYSDKVIRSFESIFLQKTLLVFKHYWDKAYLSIHIVELLFHGFDDKKNEITRMFIMRLGVYLTAISGMSSHEIKEKINKSDNNLKSEAMSIFEELIEEKGIEEGIKKTLLKLWQKGMRPNMIANYLDLEIEQVEKIILDFQTKKP